MNQLLKWKINFTKYLNGKEVKCIKSLVDFMAQNILIMNRYKSGKIQRTAYIGMNKQACEAIRSDYIFSMDQQTDQLAKYL